MFLKGVILSFLKKVLHRIKGESVSIGLDIGHTAIRAAMVLHGPKNQVLQNLAKVPLAEGVIVEGEPQNLPEISSAIQQILNQFHVDSKDVDFFLSLAVSPQILSDRVVVDSFSDLPEAKQIEDQIEKTPPFDDKEIFYDYGVLSREKEAKKAGEKEVRSKIDLLVVAAKNNHLDHWARNLQSLNLPARALDVDCFATFNAFTLQNSSIEDSRGVALLNIGEYHSYITFVVDGLYHSTRLLDRTSISQLSRSLLSKVNLKNDQVRPLLFGEVEGHEAERISILEQIVSAVATSENFFKSNVKGIRLERIFICGGGGAIQGLPEVLMARGNYKTVEAYSALAHIDVNSHLASKIKIEQSSEYAVALGLALRRS